MDDEKTAIASGNGSVGNPGVGLRASGRHHHNGCRHRNHNGTTRDNRGTGDHGHPRTRDNQLLAYHE